MRIETRSPHAGELPAVRMLLPGEFAGAPRDCLIAVSPDPPYALGAASFVRLADSIANLRIAVVRNHLRQGIGKRIFEHIRATATAREISGWADALQDPAAAAFARACGFVHRDRVATCETPVEPGRVFYQALRGKLAGHGRIPSNAHIVPLGSVRRASIARMWSDHIAAGPGIRADVVSYGLGAGIYTESPVLVRGEVIAAFLLFRVEGCRAIVDARVVAPHLRGGWANALIVAAFLDAVPHGTTQAVFSWHRGNSDTTKLAARFPGRITQLIDYFSTAP